MNAVMWYCWVASFPNNRSHFQMCHNNMAWSIYQSNYYETYLICPGSGKYLSLLEHLLNYRSARQCYHHNSCLKSIYQKSILLDIFLILLLTWASFRSKQQTYSSITSTEQRRGLFHNVLRIGPELQLHSQAPLCDVAQPSLQHWHPDCGLWSVRAWGAVTACCSFSRRKKKKKKIYIYKYIK